MGGGGIRRLGRGEGVDVPWCSLRFWSLYFWLALVMFYHVDTYMMGAAEGGQGFGIFTRGRAWAFAGDNGNGNIWFASQHACIYRILVYRSI